MRILLVRHAIAEERDTWAKTGASDDQRPLTPEGAKKMKKAAKGLMELVPQLAAIATSPLTRAWQTAEIVANQYHGRSADVLPALAPDGKREDVLTWINQFEGGTVALVGHEPDLGELTGWLIARRPEIGIEFKKGGAALLEFGTQRDAGTAVLRWLLTNGHLRALRPIEPAV
ncbi:MAG: phosphohistidine phosphatase SixA [Gemmatimonadetes bacterium]|nr:phosphohistidine phosphatase SixA [Gemmatimonadota bacterium]